MVLGFVALIMWNVTLERQVNGLQGQVDLLIEMAHKEQYRAATRPIINIKRATVYSNEGELIIEERHSSKKRRRK